MSRGNLAHDHRHIEWRRLLLPRRTLVAVVRGDDAGQGDRYCVSDNPVFPAFQNR